MPVIFIFSYLLISGLSLFIERIATRAIHQIFPPTHWAARLFSCTSIAAFIAWVICSASFLFPNHCAIQTTTSSLLILFFGNILGKSIFTILTLPMQLFAAREQKKRILAFASLSLCLFWGYGLKGLYNAHHPKVKSIELHYSNLPENFDGYKVVFISDLHLGIFGSYSNLPKRTVDQINEIKPDLLIVGGDWVSFLPHEINPSFDKFKHLSARDGKFGVMGNHDYMTYNRYATPQKQKADSFLLKEYVRHLGFRWLDNTHATLRRGNDSIVLVGVENWGEGRFGQKGDIDHALAGVADSAFTILASHNPEHFRQVIQGQRPIALTLSGHTHAMQTVITLFGRRLSPASWFYPLWGGLYEFGTQKLFVSEGLGCSLYAFRIGSTAEIAEIILRRQP